MGSKLGFLLSRVAALVITLLIVSFVVFCLLALAPGDPAQLLLGPGNASPEALANIRAQYHLDEPLLTQYGIWLTNMLHGDFGRSIRSGQPVGVALAERLPVTLSLGLYAFALTALIAIPAGLSSGMRRGSRLDRSVTMAGLIGLSVPPFAVAILLLNVFAVSLRWFPAYGAGSGFADMVAHLTLPAISLAIGQIAIISRQTRAATMDVAGRDYVSFARARGTSSSIIWRSYILHNAALPVITTLGVVLAYSLTGAVLVETAFGLPGLGSLLIESVSGKDLPVVQVLTLLTALIVLLVNFVVDLSYFALSPRLRRSGRQK